VLEIIAVSRDVTERKRAEEERERSLARELQIRAQAEERRRISRELHDRVAHSMGVVHQSLQLYEALKERDPSQAEAEMKLAKEMAREALDFTRNLSRKLRDSEVEDSLSAALSNFLRIAVPPDLEYDVSIEGEESLVPLHVREQLFLILREGIRNAVSHSGCGRIAVRIEVNPNRIVGCVEDDGQGFAEGDRSAGNGIRSMRERAEFLGGTFELFSTPGAGTKIKASIPLKEAPVGKTKPNDGTADEGR
jgi:signal transduction histidine kinase